MAGTYEEGTRISFPTLHPLEDVAWRSDHPPLPEAAIQDLLAKRQACASSFKDVDEEIDALFKRLHILETYRANLTKRIENIDSGIAQWKTLPVEILSRIFELANEDGGTVIPPYESWGSRVQVLRALGWSLPAEKSVHPERVCSLWRNIAHQTPSLWESGAILWRAETACGRHDALMRQAIEYIHRGMSSLVLGVYRLRTDRACFERFFSGCSQHLKQIKVIALHGSTQLLVEVVFSALQSSTKAEELLIDIRSPYETADYTPTSTDQNLSTIMGVLKCLTGRLIDHLITTHLKRLEIDYHVAFTPVDAQAIFSGITSLAHCRIGVDFSRAVEGLSQGGQRINLPNMTDLTLQLKNPCEELLAAFFRPFQFPAAQKMDFWLVKNAADVTEDAFVGLITRSDPALEYFGIYTSGSEPHSIQCKPLLDALSPSIRQLVLPHITLFTRDLERIAKQEILTGMTSLACSSFVNAQSVDLLAQILESRTTPFQSLIITAVDSGAMVGHDVLNNINDLRDRYGQTFACFF